MNRMVTRRLILTCIILMLVISGVSAGMYVSVTKAELASARSDEARWRLLYDKHITARKQGVTVKYPKKYTINIDIPKDATSIILERSQDFNGCTFNVTNNANDLLFLFTIYQSGNEVPLSIPKEVIESGNFSSVKALASGLKILKISDRNEWVARREGYSYGATRKDILLLRNGIAENKPVASYSTASSDPICTYRNVSDENITVKNVRFRRAYPSSARTFLLRVLDHNNVSVSNVSIYTNPNETKNADQCICCKNCTNLTFDDIDINGTYSGKSDYGYGISLDNVWNVTFNRMTANAKWGVFGNNNVSLMTLNKCRINRFDCHCYGANFYCNDCDFFDMYNQVSSIYGEIRFDNCTFTNFRPLLFEYSYNAYTGFELYFTDCTFNANATHNYIIYAGELRNVINERPELSEKCWPNVHIKNMRINTTADVKSVYLFKIRGEKQYTQPIGYISSIDIESLTMSNPRVTFYDCDVPIISERPLRTKFSKVPALFKRRIGNN